jgi:hypothetical protein
MLSGETSSMVFLLMGHLLHISITRREPGRRSAPAGYNLTAKNFVRRPHDQAIECDDGDRAAKIIQDALGIESDDVVNYCFPKNRPEDREQRARIIGEWLQTEARYLAQRHEGWTPAVDSEFAGYSCQLSARYPGEGTNDAFYEWPTGTSSPR